jgi:hypothetical protein
VDRAWSIHGGIAAHLRRARKLAIALGILLLAAGLADQTLCIGHGAHPAHVSNAAHLFEATPPRTPLTSAALLVNGGFAVGKNHRRYWNNLAFMYRALRAAGWQELHVLDADGSAGVPDRNQRSILGMMPNGVLEDSPLDLDDDGKADVSGPATLRAIDAELGKIGPVDRLFVFLTDHGQLRRIGGETRAVMMAWNEEFTGASLDEVLRRRVPSTTQLTVLATQCHGALFLEEVTRPGTVLMASGAPLWIWSDQDYSVFPYHFASALVRRDAESLEPIAADDDGDGVVSLSEAFDVARARDHAPEWPRTWTASGSR